MLDSSTCVVCGLPFKREPHQTRKIYCLRLACLKKRRKKKKPSPPSPPKTRPFRSLTEQEREHGNTLASYASIKAVAQRIGSCTSTLCTALSNPGGRLPVTSIEEMMKLTREDFTKKGSRNKGPKKPLPVFSQGWYLSMEPTIPESFMERKMPRRRDWEE
jgi:hypothetical protein